MDNSQPKKRFPLSRVARLTFRAMALALLLALVVGWLASYAGYLHIQRRLPDNRRLVLTTYRGGVALFYLNFANYPRVPRVPPMKRPWSIKFWEPHERLDDVSQAGEPFAFRVGETNIEPFFFAAPYWFLTNLAAMATTLSFKRTWRFTTRELLLATTAVSLLLGAVAWSMRS